jgi:hypothetical protein
VVRETAVSKGAARPAKLQPIGGDVEAFLDAIPNKQRQADARTLVALSSEITGERPVLWAAGIVGFGEYRYRYPSGRKGVAGLAAFAPRKDSLVIYLIGDYQNHYRRLLDQLGPHRVGKSCLYVKRLSNIDLDVLAQLIVRSVDARREMDRAASV